MIKGFHAPTLFWKTVLICGFLVLGKGFAHAEADPILPASRQAAWAGNVGVPGGIPFFAEGVNVKNPPFNAVGDGIHDDWRAIQKAIAACPYAKAVYLPAGTYRIGTNLSVPMGYPLKMPSLVLRGDGAGKTTIALDGQDDDPVIRIKHGTAMGPPIAIIGGLAQNSYAITLESTTLIKPGMILSITELNDSNFVSINTYYRGGQCNYCGERGQRVLQQFVLVTSVNHRTVGIKPPLLFNYNPALSPEARSCAMIGWCGVESMTLRRLRPSIHHGGSHCIDFGNAAWCWARNVETAWPQGAHVRFAGCFQCQLEGCYFHDGWTQNSGQDYGVWIFNHNSNLLIENCIFKNMRHSMVFEGGGAACVFGYNFSTNPIAGEDTTSFLSGDELTHGAHPWFNLYEGNVSSNIRGDYTHGSSSHNTYFRENIYLTSYAESNALAVERLNWSRTEGGQQTRDGYPGGWILGPGAKCGGAFAVDFEAWTHSNSVMGCVFETNSPGPFIFAVTNLTTQVPYSTGVIERVGYLSPGASGLAVDGVAQASTIWHGNWDPVNGGVVWDPSNRDHHLPDSFYLTARPAWWNGSPWPAIGPDRQPMVSRIPAQTRYEALAASGE